MDLVNNSSTYKDREHVKAAWRIEPGVDQGVMDHRVIDPPSGCALVLLSAILSTTKMRVYTDRSYPQGLLFPGVHIGKRREVRKEALVQQLSGRFSVYRREWFC